MATLIEMEISDSAPYPKVIIADRSDAQSFCKILTRNGVSWNIREVDSHTQRSLRTLTLKKKYSDVLTATSGLRVVAPKELLDVIEEGDEYILEIYKFNHIGGFLYKDKWYGRKTDKQIDDEQQAIIDESKRKYKKFINDNRDAFAIREDALPDWAKEILTVHRKESEDRGEDFDYVYMGWAYTLVALEYAVLLTNNETFQQATEWLKYSAMPDAVKEFEEEHGLSGNQTDWAQAVARGYLESQKIKGEENNGEDPHSSRS